MKHLQQIQQQLYIILNSCSEKSSNPDQNLINNTEFTDEEFEKVEEIKEICSGELRSQLMQDYDKNRPPQIMRENVIFVRLQISHIMELDQLKGLAEMSGYLQIRYDEKRLKWDKADWGGVELLYFKSDMIQVPDLVLSNNANSTSQEVTLNKNSVHTIIRVWNERAPLGDKIPQNVEQSPLVNIQATHLQNMDYFPLDIQEIEITCESWMTQSEGGQVRVKGLSEASTANPDDIQLSLDADESRFELLSTRTDIGVYNNDDSDQVFYQVKFFFTIKRQNIKFFLVVFVPSIIILSLAFVNLLVSTDDNKVNRSIQFMMINSIQMLITNNNIPKNKKFGMYELAMFLLFQTLFIVNFLLCVNLLFVQRYNDINNQLNSIFKQKELVNNRKLLPKEFHKFYINIGYSIEMICILILSSVIIYGTILLFRAVFTDDIIFQIVSIIQLVILSIIYIIYKRLLAQRDILDIYFKFKKVQMNFSKEMSNDLASKFKKRELSMEEVSTLFKEIYLIQVNDQIQTDLELTNQIQDLINFNDFESDKLNLNMIQNMIYNFWGMKEFEFEKVTLSNYIHSKIHDKIYEKSQTYEIDQNINNDISIFKEKEETGNYETNAAILM